LNNKEKNRKESMKFGEAYFDGVREQGYGGYYYDGRWTAVAERAVEYYDITPMQHVLDIGCAKGFFVHDLRKVLPGLDARGLDISNYAITHSPPETTPFLQVGNAVMLPFEDHSFDVVFSINTVHNLERDECISALREMTRVCKKPENCFVQVDAYRTPEEKKVFENWMLTAKTYGTPEDWTQIFREAGYLGDYFWTILEFNSVD
jgi:ubiquinone/menaquinone biosynthesis C-methylase UbiE